MCTSSQQSFSYLSEKLFIPFELNDNDHVSDLSDVDPDFNFFSSYNQVGAKCNYYLESSFNADVAENKCVKNIFSVCHANIQSISKNLNSLESYLNTLDHEFTIVGLTHWGRGKMAAIFRSTLSITFSWMKMLEFRFKCHCSLNWQHSSIGSDNGLAPARRQAIIWTNDG